MGVVVWEGCPWAVVCAGLHVAYDLDGDAVYCELSEVGAYAVSLAVGDGVGDVGFQDLLDGVCASSGGGDVDVVGLDLEALEGVAEAAHDGPGDSSALEGVVEGQEGRNDLRVDGLQGHGH